MRLKRGHPRALELGFVLARREEGRKSDGEGMGIGEDTARRILYQASPRTVIFVATGAMDRCSD